MKKILIAGFLFISVLFILAPSAKAATIAELQAQINALMAQLTALQAQQSATNGTTTATTPTGDFCYMFTRSLKIGDGKNSFSEPMVRALQTALEKEGFVISLDEKKAGSVFGKSTEAAVIGFQEKYADEILTPNGLTNGNGFVGVSTRIKLNDLYGCNGSTVPNIVPTISSISPAQGTVDTNVIINGSNLAPLSYVGIYSSGGVLVKSMPFVSMKNISSQMISFTLYKEFVSDLSSGVYQMGVVTNNCIAGCNSNKMNFTITNSVTNSTAPSIHITGSSGGKSSNTSLSVNVGDTITISGIPQNLQGMAYYYGSGYPTSGYYNMAYFFDQNFGNNNLCGNNAATVNGPWTMTCTAKVAGSSVFYIVIYANGQTYQSNVVTVTVGQTTTTAPTASLSINSSFGSGSNTATAGTYKVLDWSSTNSNRCDLSSSPLNYSWADKGMSSSGSRSVGPINQTTTFALTCYNSALQSVTQSVTINVSNAPTSAPEVSFSANPTSITAGQSARITLDTSNSKYCMWPYEVLMWPVYKDVYPTQTSTYEATCYNNLGQSTIKNVTVTVSPATSSTTPAPTAYLNNASDQKNAVSVTSGSPVNFVWGATNFTKCQMFKNGVLFNDGVYNSYGVNVPSYTGTFYVPNQTQSATYTLTCTGAGGSQSGSVAVSISGQTVTPTNTPLTTSGNDPYSANYSQTSSIPLSSTEKTVSYTYASYPCGGLMTDYINPGSVYVGNGPVYASASTACSPATPNTTTFRVYSCRNNASLQGQATFAFQCNAVTSSLNIAQPNYASVYESLRGLLQQLSGQLGN